MPITVKSLASVGDTSVATPRNAPAAERTTPARRLLRPHVMCALVATLTWIAALGPARMAGAELIAGDGPSLALPPGRARLGASSLADGAILMVDITPAPPSLEAALLAPPAPADLAIRVERLSSDKLRLKIAARDGRCNVRLEGRLVKCRRPTDAESRERVAEMVREPLDVAAGEGAAEMAAAQRLVAAGDLDGAANLYTRLRRGYATRGVAELRLADLLWLAGHAPDAVAEWGRVAVRFRRRAEGRIAAIRAAAAAWHLEGVPPTALPETERPEEPFGADAALARAHLLGGLGRFEAALEQLRVAAPPALLPSFEKLSSRLLAAGIRLTVVRGEPMRTTLLFRRHFALVRSHSQRVDLELATADALLDLDLVQEAVEVVDDALGAAHPGAEKERVGTWIDRVRGSLASPASTALPGAPQTPSPLSGRLTMLAAEVDAVALEARP